MTDTGATRRRRRTLASPVGRLVVSEACGFVVGVRWSRATADDDSPLLREAARQLIAYFDGDLRRFDLPLHVEGNAFQRAACEAMLAIPYGETRTYGDLARELGTMPQAVGQACGHNPIAVIVPCHRVTAANDLGGFSGGSGLETKIALLRHEGGFPYLL